MRPLGYHDRHHRSVHSMAIRIPDHAFRLVASQDEEMLDAKVSSASS